MLSPTRTKNERKNCWKSKRSIKLDEQRRERVKENCCLASHENSDAIIFIFFLLSFSVRRYEFTFVVLVDFSHEIRLIFCSTLQSSHVHFRRRHFHIRLINSFNRHRKRKIKRKIGKKKNECEIGILRKVSHMVRLELSCNHLSLSTDNTRTMISSDEYETSTKSLFLVGLFSMAAVENDGNFTKNDIFCSLLLILHSSFRLSFRFVSSKLKIVALLIAKTIESPVENRIIKPKLWFYFCSWVWSCSSMTMLQMPSFVPT